MPPTRFGLDKSSLCSASAALKQKDLDHVQEGLDCHKRKPPSTVVTPPRNTPRDTVVDRGRAACYSFAGGDSHNGTTRLPTNWNDSDTRLTGFALNVLFLSPTECNPPVRLLQSNSSAEECTQEADEQQHSLENDALRPFETSSRRRRRPRPH